MKRKKIPQKKLSVREQIKLQKILAQELPYDELRAAKESNKILFDSGDEIKF